MSRPLPFDGIGAAPARLDVGYAAAGSLAAQLADPRVLAVFGFGEQAPVVDDPRWLRVPLQPLLADAPIEVWRSDAPVTHGRDGAIAWTSDGRLLFGAIEVDEPDAGIEAAATQAYARIAAFVAASGTPHLLRMWNYMDAITLGEGDDERYRRFCVGRADGLTWWTRSACPRPRRSAAATAAAGCRCTGWPHASPAPRWRTRARSAPGATRASTARSRPVSPGRCCRPPARRCPCWCPGPRRSWATPRSTAARSSTRSTRPWPTSTAWSAPRARRPSLPPALGAASPLKVYVRDPADAPAIAAQLQRRLDPSVPRLLLHAQVCRRELLVEIDGAHGEPATA